MKPSGKEKSGVFRKLLKFFPFDFRYDHGEEMEQFFYDRSREVENKGQIAKLKLCWEIFVNLLYAAPREHWDMLRQDAKFGLRTLKRNGGFTTVAILTLAVGIGANTAVFSILHSVILSPLPYPDSDRLVRLYDRNMEWNAPAFSVSPAHFFHWKRESQLLEHSGAYRESGFNLMIQSEPVWTYGVRASAGLFEVLGVEPEMGRWFNYQEDTQGGPRAIVISYGLWRNWFAGRADVIGQELPVDGIPHTVVGVMPASFIFPQQPGVEILVPYRLSPEQGGHFLRVLGRMKSGASVEALNAELNSLTAPLEPGQSWEVFTTSLHEDIVQPVSDVLWILFAAVGLVLLIACANVANLLLVRGAAREADLAIRSTLGAGRARLMRQLLTESLLLALSGGLAGILLAYAAVYAVTVLAPGNLPRTAELAINVPVLLFALGISVFTGLLFGMAPALRVSKGGLRTRARSDSANTLAGTRSRLKTFLVAAEIAMALMLMIAAALLIQSLHNEQRVKLGFETENILTFQLSPLESRYPEARQRAALYQDFIEAVESLPGVESAGMTHRLPLSGTSAHPISIDGRSSNDTPPTGIYYASTPGYLETLRIPLLRGRMPSEEETFERISVVVVNQEFVDRFFPDEDAIGKRVLLAAQPQKVWLEIVGIVGNVRNNSLTEAYQPTFYFPYLSYSIPSMVMTVRASVPAHSILPAIRERIREIEPAQPIGQVQSIEDYLSNLFATERFNTSMMALFASLALFLTAVGVYGVISFSVSRKTHEVGLRMALGAQRSDILRLFMKGGLFISSVGILVGLLGAYLLSNTIAGFLFGVEANDPWTFACVGLLLLTVSLAATYLPTRRALAMSPLTALRDGNQ